MLLDRGKLRACRKGREKCQGRVATSGLLLLAKGLPWFILSSKELSNDWICFHTPLLFFTLC